MVGAHAIEKGPIVVLDNIFQIAYVTRNIDKARANFRAQANIRTEVYYEGEVPVKTPAGPRISHIKLAFMWVGDFQYELIQPISGWKISTARHCRRTTRWASITPACAWMTGINSGAMLKSSPTRLRSKEGTARTISCIWTRARLWAITWNMPICPTKYGLPQAGGDSGATPRKGGRG